MVNATYIRDRLKVKNKKQRSNRRIFEILDKIHVVLTKNEH
jgi:hypothetical protein